MIRTSKWANLAAKGLAILIIFAFSRILSNPQENKTKTGNIVKRMSKNCGELYCHSVQVPLNHLGKNSQVFIEIQVAIYKAKVQPSGKAIVLLPPGPGRSGIDFLSHTGSDLAEMFDNQVDIISFDSRWVGKINEYVKCIPKSHQASYLNYNIMAGAPILPQNPSRNQQLILDKAAELGSLMCATNAAALLQFVSTANTARDMECIRKYFNMDKLDIWSFGHGGLLAATYAHIFPDKAGQVIIDSSKNFDVYQGNVLDLVSEFSDSTNKAIEILTNNCDQSEGCPLYQKGQKSITTLLEFLEKLESSPIVYKEGNNSWIISNEMVQQLIVSWTSIPMQWIVVADAISSAINGYFQPIVRITSKKPFGIDKLFSLWSVLCAETKKPEQIPLEEWMKSLDAQFSSNFWLTQFVGCRHWKRYSNMEIYSGPWDSKITDRMLLIGNLMHPHSPIPHNKMVENFLLHKGIGQTSLSQKSKCTNEFIKDFMINGNFPPNHTVCEPDDPLFPTTASREEHFNTISRSIDFAFLNSTVMGI